jgi:hypothetical protein
MSDEGETPRIAAAPPGPVAPAAEAAWSRRPKGIDSAIAAQMLAEGRSIAEVARAVGCSRQNLWRQVRHSRRLAVLIRAAEQEARTDAHGKLTGLGEAAVETLCRAITQENDAGIAYRIADRLDLFQRPAAADPTRGRVSGGRMEFAAVLAAVTERVKAASRGRNIRFEPADYIFAWDEAVRERRALHEAGPAHAAPRRRD